MIGWLVGGIVAWLALAASTIAMCKAAARGDHAHAHHPPLDELERLYAEPDRYCPTCGTWLGGDALWCHSANPLAPAEPECQSVWEGA